MPETRDARTTPRWARFPILVAFSGLVIYFLLCFHFTMRTSGTPDWAWFGGWKMFTTRDSYHAELTAKALVDGAWEDIDLELLFPSQWDSGPRYARGPFRRNPYRMRVLGASTCHRMAPTPTGIRFTETRWKKTLGQHEQPKLRGIKERVLLDWSCEEPLKLAGGRSLP